MSATYKFVPLDSRLFRTINPDVDEALAVSTGDHDFSARREYEDAIVRVRYEATEEQARRIDHGAITRALYDAGAHKVFVQPEIVRAQRARADGVDESLAPMTALDLWLDANGIGREALDEPVELAQRSLDQADQLRTLTARYIEEFAA